MARDHIAGGSISNFHTGGPHQRNAYQITSDITAPSLDHPSRSHFHTGKIMWCPVQQLSQEKSQTKTLLEEAVMIQAWNLEY